MRIGSVAHRLCSVSCGLEDLFTLKKKHVYRFSGATSFLYGIFFFLIILLG